jgi:ribosomal protein L4
MRKICGFRNEILEGEDIVVLFVYVTEKERLRLRAPKYKEVKYTEVSYKHHSYECLKAMDEKRVGLAAVPSHRSASQVIRNAHG